MRKVVFLLPLLSLLILTQLMIVMAENQPVSLTEKQLVVISEETGMIPSHLQLSPDCTLSQQYQIYLCPDNVPISRTATEPNLNAAAQQAIFTTGLLLIPDSTQDRVMAFDPMTGDLIDPDFISDTVHLITPFNAILNAAGDGILVSDQASDLIYEYNLDGSYRGIFAPVGGADRDILFNPRGIVLTDDGTLLVTTTEDNVLAFDEDGQLLGEFIQMQAGGLDSPFDIHGQAANWLVTGFFSDAVHRYDSNGAFLDNLTVVPAESILEQIAVAQDGVVYVANFGEQRGVLEVATNGVTNTITIASDLGHRGVYILPNDNLLTTVGAANDGRVYEIDGNGTIIDTKLTSTTEIPITPRYIEFVKAPTKLYLPLILNN